MGAPTTTSATSTTGRRLKREDFRYTKHDSAFSQWKILIGASDWKDHSLGREGAERYRTHNLPNCTSCPGVYELGIGISRLQSGRDDRKLESSAVVPVYLGQADNVRNRLQQYGREGAHLGNGCSNGGVVVYQSTYSDSSPGLFTEIFSRGYPIVYRWAPMESKKDAKKTESLLLERFDYAWNKGSNGARRPDDILKKIDLYPRASLFSLLAKKLQLSNRKQVGVEIKTREPFFVENREDLCTDMNNNGIFSRVFKTSRSRPILVSSPSGSSHICGVAVGYGSICTKPAVEGRKRCPEHKGMKVNGSISKLNIDRKGSSDGFQNPGLTHTGVINQPYDFELHISDRFAPICGVILDNGSPCKMQPALRNKRCLEHKGRRVSRSTPKLNIDRKGSSDGFQNPGLTHTGVINQPYDFELHISDRFAPICGVILDNGSPCKKQPALRNKRCSEHKGRRVSRSTPKFVGQEMEQKNLGSGSCVNKIDKTICGIHTEDGKICMRQPVSGRKRCNFHRGMRLK